MENYGDEKRELESVLLRGNMLLAEDLAANGDIIRSYFHLTAAMRLMGNTPEENAWETDVEAHEGYATLLETYRSRRAVLGYYDVLVNDEDNSDIMMVIKSQPGDVTEPVFYYDGGKHGLLFKNSEVIALCDYIHPATHGFYLQCSEILVTEVQDKCITSEYSVPVIICSGVERLCELLIEEPFESLLKEPFELPIDELL